MKAQWQWFFSGVLVLLTGIFFMVNPSAVVKVAVIAFGAYTVLEALYSLVLSWKLRKMRTVFAFNTVRILISLIVGLIVIYFAATAPGARVASWAVWLIALWLLASSIIQLFQMLYLRKLGFSGYSVLSSCIISFVLSVIMFLFPVMISNALMTVAGIIMIIASLFMIFLGIRVIAASRNENFDGGGWTDDDKNR